MRTRFVIETKISWNQIVRKFSSYMRVLGWKCEQCDKGTRVNILKKLIRTGGKCKVFVAVFTYNICSCLFRMAWLFACAFHLLV